MLGAIKFAHEEIKKHCAVQIELSKELGKDVKRTYCHEVNDEELRQTIIKELYDKAYAIATSGTMKHEREDMFNALEAEFAARYTEEELVERTHAVAAEMPVIGFYLQTACGGRRLSYEYWKAVADTPGVVAIKCASFNRYQSIDLVRGVAYSARREEIALYTGNDDNIVADLLTPYRFPVDGKEVERTGEGGCFGVSVSLAYGKNYFTFRNGEDSLTLTIRRGSGTGDGTTSTLTSRFPTSDAAVWAGQELTFRCVAPSGSKVTAVIHGQTVTMQQTAATAKNGIAATYKGTYQVPADLPEGELQDWGPVKYTMVWGGKTTSYESAGRLYAAGKNTTPAVLANTENVSLLTDYTDDSTFIATYHRGAKIPMVGCFQYNGTIFYEVAGGYISSDRATVAPSPAKETTIGEVSSVTEGRLTTITLPCGSYPAASAKREGALLTIYLENTALPESTEGIAAPMIKEARWEETEGGVNLLLTLNEESYWGYDLQYTEEGDLLLSLKEPPKLSATPGKPLEGITVMVDPGHGNKDCGAYGAAGLYGPAEAELNLAVSLAVRDRLEQMGATVIMTRETDDRETPKIVLDERVRMAVDAKPDFFLSIHHNSTGLTRYVSADWTVSYYCEDDSETYAANLAAAVTGATDRDTKGEEWGYYYVTRLGFCPAVLFEVGFIPNPEQYEACADWETICETASGLAEGLLRSVPR